MIQLFLDDNILEMYVKIYNIKFMLKFNKKMNFSGSEIKINYEIISFKIK